MIALMYKSAIQTLDISGKKEGGGGAGEGQSLYDMLWLQQWGNM